MGKKIIGVIAFAAIAAAAGWNYTQNNQKVELSDLALENVEALARGEGIDQNGYKYVAEPRPCCKKYSHEYQCSDVWPDC